MARPNKPWYKKTHGNWYATIDGKTHNLGKDETEAYKKFYLLMANRGDSVPVQQPGEYVNHVFQEFLYWAKKNLSPRTVEGYFEFLDGFDQAHRSLRIDELKKWHLEKWLDEQKTWGSTRKANAATAVIRALNWAVDYDKIAHNPLKGFRKPQRQTRTRYVTPEEFEAIMRHVKSSHCRDLLTVTYDTGARPREVNRLEARHLRLDQQIAVIPAAEAKGGKRDRVIAIPTARSLEILRRLAEKYPEGPLFRTKRGNAWSRNAVAHLFRRVAKYIGRQVTQYEFRHGFVTRSLMAGVDSHTVAVLAGHSDTRMIDQVYSHVHENHDYLVEQAKRAS